eukprot:m.71816 g.71816  ORF g.71816 m.71816 type:complete len:834 (-) comp8363_c0_seq1:228-2729(-)
MSDVEWPLWREGRSGNASIQRRSPSPSSWFQSIHSSSLPDLAGKGTAHANKRVTTPDHSPLSIVKGGSNNPFGSITRIRRESEHKDEKVGKKMDVEGVMNIFSNERKDSGLRLISTATQRQNGSDKIQDDREDDNKAIVLQRPHSAVSQEEKDRRERKDRMGVLRSQTQVDVTQSSPTSPRLLRRQGGHTDMYSGKQEHEPRRAYTPEEGRQRHDSGGWRYLRDLLFPSHSSKSNSRAASPSLHTQSDTTENAVDYRTRKMRKKREKREKKDRAREEKDEKKRRRKAAKTLLKMNILHSSTTTNVGEDDKGGNKREKRNQGKGKGRGRGKGKCKGGDATTVAGIDNNSISISQGIEFSNDDQGNLSNNRVEPKDYGYNLPQDALDGKMQHNKDSKTTTNDNEPIDPSVTHGDADSLKHEYEDIEDECFPPATENHELFLTTSPTNQRGLHAHTSMNHEGNNYHSSAAEFSSSENDDSDVDDDADSDDDSESAEKPAYSELHAIRKELGKLENNEGLGRRKSSNLSNMTDEEEYIQLGESRDSMEQLPIIEESNGNAEKESVEELVEEGAVAPRKVLRRSSKQRLGNTGSLGSFPERKGSSLVVVAVAAEKNAANDVLPPKLPPRMYRRITSPDMVSSHGPSPLTFIDEDSTHQHQKEEQQWESDRSVDTDSPRNYSSGEETFNKYDYERPSTAPSIGRFKVTEIIEDDEDEFVYRSDLGIKVEEPSQDELDALANALSDEERRRSPKPYVFHHLLHPRKVSSPLCQDFTTFSDGEENKREQRNKHHHHHHKNMTFDVASSKADTNGSGKQRRVGRHRSNTSCTPEYDRLQRNW